VIPSQLREDRSRLRLSPRQKRYADYGEDLSEAKALSKTEDDYIKHKKGEVTGLQLLGITNSSRRTVPALVVGVPEWKAGMRINEADMMRVKEGKNLMRRDHYAPSPRALLSGEEESASDMNSTLTPTPQRVPQGGSEMEEGGHEAEPEVISKLERVQHPEAPPAVDKPLIWDEDYNNLPYDCEFDNDYKFCLLSANNKGAVGNVFGNRLGEIFNLPSHGDNRPPEPKTLREALEGPHADRWIAAMEEEVSTLTERGTWELQELPANRKSLGVKWVFTIKTDESGAVSRF
jgi:hypothetical protein